MTKNLIRPILATLFLFHLNLLQAADTTPPGVFSITPAPGSTMSNFTRITVVFNEPVVGVAPYGFEFAAQPAGANVLAWAGGHGIRDLAATPNAFSGGSWSYTVDPSAARNVVINEILAIPLSTNNLADEDGQFSDWIELY